MLLARVNRLKASGWIIVPSEVFDPSRTGAAQATHVLPLGHGLQRMARSHTDFGQFHERIFLYHPILVIPSISGCVNWNGTESLTLTRVKIITADPKTAPTGVALVVFLRAVRVSMSELSIAVVVERDSTLGGVLPTAQGSKVVMMHGSGQWGLEGGQLRVRSDSWVRCSRVAYILQCCLVLPHYCPRTA